MANADSVVDLNVAIAFGTRLVVIRHTVHATNVRRVPKKATNRRTRIESFSIGALNGRGGKGIVLGFGAFVTFAAAGGRAPDLVLVFGVVDRFFCSGAALLVFRAIACIGDAFFVSVMVAFAGGRAAPR